MKKIFLLLFIIVILIFSAYLYFKKAYPTINPSKQLDQAADSSRRSHIKLSIQPAIAQYYQKYNKAPASLNDLVSEKFMKSVPTDPVTKKEPMYNSNDSEHGCKAWYVLSDNTEIATFCY